MKILAYGGIPKQGGIFTFYQTLRSHLKNFDWDVRCVTVGSQINSLWDDRFADEGCVRVASHETSVKGQAFAFTNWCIEQNVSIVIPAHSTPLLCAIPHLPVNIPVISRSIDSQEIGYQRMTYAEERISRFVATAPIHIDVLTNRYGIAQEKIAFIPHGIDIEQFGAKSRQLNFRDPLRLIFIGRLYHPEKGILFLPDILQGLEERGIRYHLTIIGAGDDEAALRRRLQSFVEMNRVNFTGLIPRAGVPGYLADADIILFPSQHEAFGFALIEGMAAGCAVIASRLPGVTDFIIQDGETGILCSAGDVRAFVEAIIAFDTDRMRLKSFQEKAFNSAAQRFSHEKMARDYLALFEVVLAEPPLTFVPKRWENFAPPDFARYSRFGFLPRPVRVFARRVLHRLT